MLPETKILAEEMQAAGRRPILVATSDELLPEILFRAPTIGEISTYVLQASLPETGPVIAAAGLARICVSKGHAELLAGAIDRKPLLVMRAIQVILRDLGLSARAEKKSLS